MDREIRSGCGCSLVNNIITSIGIYTLLKAMSGIVCQNGGMENYNDKTSGTFLSPPLLFDVIYSLMLCNYYIISVMIMLYYVTILYMQFIAVDDNDEMTFSTNQCLYNLAN